MEKATHPYITKMMCRDLGSEAASISMYYSKFLLLEDSQLGLTNYKENTDI